MNYFKQRRLIALLSTAGLLGLSSSVFASAFQLWEQDGATVGNYHAGYAAEADNASTAFYNPAGITRFQNQQITMGAIAVMTNMKYEGTVDVNPFLGVPPQSTTAQGGNFAVLPALHYVTPLTDKLGFGFSIDVPFGLKTNYGDTTIVRYATTQAAITVIDFSPSLAYRITDKFSLGAGLDIQRMFLELDEAATPFVGVEDFPDTYSTNKFNDTAYGYHAGILYEFTPDARIGASYHSQVVHHLTGTSQFTGELANISEVGGPYSSHATTNMTLPPYTALSGFYKVHPQWAVMASAIYTQWDTIRTITLNGLSGMQDFVVDKNIQVVLPQYFKNTWNFTVGTDFYATDKVTLRGGVGYDQTPVQNAYRTVALPDNNRYVLALGTHMQATKAIGFDLGWMHVFGKQAVINPPLQIAGDDQVATNGHANGGADVFSGQVTWDMA